MPQKPVSFIFVLFHCTFNSFPVTDCRVLSASYSQSGGPGVQVTLWPLAGFVLGRPELKSSATLVNSQLGVPCQLGFLILLCRI